MKYEEIEKQAKKRVKAKKDFFMTAATFAFISMILLIIAFLFPFPLTVRILMLIPILVFGFILGTMYLTTFGVPGSKFLSEEWEEEEKKREIASLYRQHGVRLPEDEELTDEDRLELKELERLQEKWRDHEGYI